jgi:hypothetical protein
VKKEDVCTKKRRACTLLKYTEALSQLIHQRDLMSHVQKKERFVTIATKTVVDVLLHQFSKLQTQRHHYAT